jgi:molybdate transport system regulatory protein
LGACRAPQPESLGGAPGRNGVSCRRAWMLVDTMNRCWTEPLVVTTPGVGEARARG